MSFIYLTPASISYLTQFILALAITVFLARRLRNRTTQLVLLTGFFAGMTIFIGLLFLDAALSPFPRLLAVYAENTILALALVFLLQFAYRFPRFYAYRKWEARASLIVSLAYFLWEAQYMVYRYVSLLQWETVHYRPYVSTYANALVLLWAPIAFLRQTIAADPRPVNGLTKLWKPQGKEARGARSFVLIFGIPFVLGIIDILRIFYLPTMLYNAALAIGILVGLWLFAINYINFIPGGVSVLARLSILTLTLFLALLGSVSWIIASPYIATYHPDLTDHQTLRFTPSPSGGYAVTPVAFAFGTELGDRLPVQPLNEARNYKINFAFPFYGQSYTDIYVASSGVIGMGEPFWQPNMQARRANLPAIFPLLIELDPNAGGGLYARQEPDRLILTWDHLPALYRPKAIFTFQAVLYQDGVFDITYNGLPLPFRFDPDETPSANPWVRGATPGRGESLHTHMDNLLDPSQKDQGAIVQNYQLDFRRYLHTFILPLGWVVIGGSLLLMAGLPTLLHFSVIRPLNALSVGVRQMEAGDLNVQVAIQNQDEIGFLTNAFNKMASRLGKLVTGLEEQVAERTAELEARNKELDAFAHTVAHDIKSPLTPIVAYAEMLAEDYAAQGDIQGLESLRKIASSGHRISSIVDELMLLAGLREMEVQFEPLDMAGIVAQVQERLTQMIEDCQAEIVLHATWPVALGYGPWVEEVWVNYLSNALKYGGRPEEEILPRIELGADPLPQAGQTGREYIRFWVRDNGPGLTPEEQAKLFTPFTQLNPMRTKGHGLGLSIVQRIVEKLGGQVGVESEMGQSSLFFFTLPGVAGANYDEPQA